MPFDEPAWNRAASDDAVDRWIPIDDAVRAGRYGRARQLLATTSFDGDAELKAAAKDLKANLRPDPVALVCFALVFLSVLALLIRFLGA